jgi:diguanylate cyclase (GGDEF)-like protein
MTATTLPRILLVDDSRIVRATIIKRIRDRFSVREEVDGEAAWEALLVDPTIQVVISDLSMPRLDGYGLLERIRNSRISRIRETPVIMIFGDEDEASRLRAKEGGATDFITKGIGTAELLARLETLVKLSQTHEALAQSRAQAAVDEASGLLTRAVLLSQAEQAFSYARRHGTQVSALMIGFDGMDALAAAQGAAAAEALLARYAKLLAATVRREDSLARWTETELAIVAPGITVAQGLAFGERLRKAVAQADAPQEGQAPVTTISVGVANCPVDTLAGGEDLLAKAEARMIRARGNGGNRVLGDGESSPYGGEGVDRALEAIAAGQADSVRPYLPDLGRRVLPLLTLLEEEYRFGMPLAELAARWQKDQ